MSIGVLFFATHSVRTCRKERKHMSQANIDKYLKCLYVDLPDFSLVTEEMRIQNAAYVFTGGVRINRSMYRTTEETIKYYEKSLARKLP